MISVNNGNTEIGSIRKGNKNIREVLMNSFIIWNGVAQSCFGTGKWIDNFAWTDNMPWKDK